MTVIECFDRCPLVNIAATLAARPAELVLIGRGVDVSRPAAVYRTLLKAKGFQTVVQAHTLPVDLREATQALTALVKSHAACAIDIVGGDEALLAAAGIVYHTVGEASLSLWCTDIEQQTVEDLTHHRTLPIPAELLTVSDLIRLHGGSVRQTATLLDDRDDRDIDTLWALAKADNTAWNTRLMYLNEFEKRAGINSARLSVTLKGRSLKGAVNRFSQKREQLGMLLRALHRRGLLTELYDGDDLQYTYKNAAVREALSGAGNILEMKVLAEARRARRNGEQVFHDCVRGVTIDWDGNGPSRTHNEIDVIAMHGLTPVFISCKNGHVAEAEMYKLAAVAHRFGGTTVRKMLVVTDLPAEKRAAAHDRAASLGITLIDNAEDLSSDEWRQKLFSAIG